MPVVVIGKTAVAARLLRYTEKEKAGGVEPRVLYSEGIRCRVPTAERQFAAVRRLHGKQGAKRKAPTRYVLPESGEVANYVRRARPSGRKYWAVSKANEKATHVRRKGNGYIDEIEAVHIIMSFGLDEVNPDDPAQVRQAFEFVAKMMQRLYPGIQMKLVGQADGARNAFHVHSVLNSVVVERMEVDGVIWEAGRKMSGALTGINRLRERVDEFIALYGAEYGVEQKLPSVAQQRAEKRRARDRRMASRGEMSNHDIIRSAFEDSMDDVRATSLDGFIEVLSERDVAVNYQVTRPGKPNEMRALSYRLGEMKTSVRGTTLGDHFGYDSALQQIEANAEGVPRQRRPRQPRAGIPRPRHSPTAQELTDAQALVTQLAYEERMTRINAQMDADLPYAQFEDRDAAVEANRLGDFEELARLAATWRAKAEERWAHKKAQQGQSVAIPSPLASAQNRPPVPPLPLQVGPVLNSSESWEKDMAAILDLAQSQAQPLTDNMIAAFLRDKDRGTATHSAQIQPVSKAAIQAEPDRRERITQRPTVTHKDLRARDAKTPKVAATQEPAGELVQRALAKTERVTVIAASPPVPSTTAPKTDLQLAEKRRLQNLATLRAQLADEPDTKPSRGAIAPELGT